MEASHLTVHGERAGDLADALLESKAEEARRSINKRGVRNIHSHEGNGFTHLAYERAAAHEHSWVMVSILVEQLDERTAAVVLYVGGGGRGPFKLEEISARRLLRGEETVGQAGRFATVLEDIQQVCASLDLAVDTAWQSEVEPRLTVTLEEKIFGS